MLGLLETAHHLGYQETQRSLSVAMATRWWLWGAPAFLPVGSQPARRNGGTVSNPVPATLGQGSSRLGQGTIGEQMVGRGKVKEDEVHELKSGG